MRRLFLLALIALLAGVGLVALIETDPGYILMSYGNYTLESSLWVGLVVMALAALLVYVLVRLVGKLIAGQHSLVDWIGSRRVRRSARLTTDGLASFIEGNWDRARRQSLRGTANNEAPLGNYLVAARASHRLQEPDRAREYLRAAQAADPQSDTAVALTEAELKLEDGEYREAIDCLAQARRHAGRHPVVLDLLQRAYRGLEDWGSLLGLLPDLRKQRVLPEEELCQLEREVSARLLQHSVTQGEGPAGERLAAAWQKVPSALRQEPALVAVHARLLLEQGDHGGAGKVLARALKHAWSPELVRLYGMVESDDPQRQLGQAEAWLPSHPEDAELLLCLGRLSARDRLWGKARDYFESSYRLERRPETCAELGRLLVALGEPKVAAAYFREGLLISEAHLPPLPMPEQVIPHGQRLAT